MDVSGRNPIASLRAFEAVLWILNRRAVAYAAAKLSELQNCAPALSGLVLRTRLCAEY